MQALTYALKNNNQISVNGTNVGMTGSYVFNDNPQNSYNISASKQISFSLLSFPRLMNDLKDNSMRITHLF